MERLLKKPIVFLDIETTGVSTTKDRIVQIGAIKVELDGTTVEKSYLVNPSVPIPKEASDVHGITDEDVKDKPFFKQLAKGLFAFIEGCDIGGYNSNRFDVQLLKEEFKRCGIHFDTVSSDTVFIDVLLIERMLNSNKLGDVYKRYTGNELEDAHDALADVKATIEVFRHQLKRLSSINPSLDSMQEVDLFSQGESPRVGLTGDFILIDNEVCWSFGKNKGLPVKNDYSYAKWFLGTDTCTESKEIVSNIINGK